MSLTPLEQRVVAPFYGSGRDHSKFWADLVTVGETVRVWEVKELLRDPMLWRPARMGALFAVKFDKAEIGSELNRAMRECGGSLTALYFAASSALVNGDEAIPDMAQFVADPPTPDGSQESVAAAIEWLGGEPDLQPTARARSNFIEIVENLIRVRHFLREDR